jgi:hypothetical protein
MLRRSFVLLFLSLLFMAGCGPAEPKSYPVKGEVKLDDKPMAEGVITFFSAGYTPQELPVTNGTFKGEAREGKLRVEIAAYKAGPPVMMGTEKIEQPKVNYVDEKYNANSTMTAEVTPAGPNEFKFEVKSKAP